MKMVDKIFLYLVVLIHAKDGRLRDRNFKCLFHLIPSFVLCLPKQGVSYVQKKEETLYPITSRFLRFKRMAIFENVFQNCLFKNQTKIQSEQW